MSNLSSQPWGAVLFLQQLLHADTNEVDLLYEAPSGLALELACSLLQVLHNFMHCWPTAWGMLPAGLDDVRDLTRYIIWQGWPFIFMDDAVLKLSSPTIRLPGFLHKHTVILRQQATQTVQ